jgi:ABC-type phosphate transport system substrate-binding protein
MKPHAKARWLKFAAAFGAAWILTASASPAVKNMAVVVSAGSKLTDLPLSDLVKLCKGTIKSWPDGKAFLLVVKEPEGAEMRSASLKLFGASGSDVTAVIAKLNEAHTVVKIVESDEDLLRTVAATPGAVGIVDVYAINSAVKVLRVDGKLPFDLGYALKSNQ